MSVPTSSSATSTPSWFTPKRLLAIFCVINLLTYVDRGAIASNGVNGTCDTWTDGTCTSGSGIQGEFSLNDFEDGLLSSAFMVGLLVASPIFASLAKSMNPFRLIGVGLSVWTVAVICCGFSFDFWSISMSRMLVGVGEASFVSLAAPFIDDNAPADQKTAWLGIFYMCISTGYAVGYIYGGLVGSHFGWRYGFWGEAILMFPFAVFGFVMKPLHLKGFASAGSKEAPGGATVPDIKDDLDAEVSVSNGGISSIEEDVDGKRAIKSPESGHGFLRTMTDLKMLLQEKIYVVNVLGACAYNFVFGAYSYWGPKAGSIIYDMAWLWTGTQLFELLKSVPKYKLSMCTEDSYSESSNADLVFGGVTIITGVIGTIAGGYILDFFTSTVRNAFKLISVATFVGGIFAFAAFSFTSLYVFLALFAVGEVLLFSTQGPVNYINLHCVKPSLRPLSMAMSTVSIHLFGDVPSPPLVGILQDYINNWRETTLILTTILFLAALIWLIGIFMQRVDRFNGEADPLLENGTDTLVADA